MSRARGELTLAAALASLCPQVEGSMPPSGPSRVPAVLWRPSGGQHLPGAPTWSRAEDTRTRARRVPVCPEQRTTNRDPRRWGGRGRWGSPHWTMLIRNRMRYMPVPITMLLFPYKRNFPDDYLLALWSYPAACNEDSFFYFVWEVWQLARSTSPWNNTSFIGSDVYTPSVPRRPLFFWLLEIAFDCSSYLIFFTNIITFVMTYYITNIF